MGARRVIVPDVDEALTAYAAAGYQVAERWGPPFAILSSRHGPDIWLAGPGTSAAGSLDGFSRVDAASASDLDEHRAAAHELLRRRPWRRRTTTARSRPR